MGDAKSRELGLPIEIVLGFTHMLADNARNVCSGQGWVGSRWVREVIAVFGQYQAWSGIGG